jgi:hypothetical protein
MAAIRDSAETLALHLDGKKGAEPAPRLGKPLHKEMNPMTNWVYDVFLWTFSILVDLFFREVHPRGSWKIPRRGPIIFVAAPHANQVCTALGGEAERRGGILY